MFFSVLGNLIFETKLNVDFLACEKNSTLTYTLLCYTLFTAPEPNWDLFLQRVKYPMWPWWMQLTMCLYTKPACFRDIRLKMPWNVQKMRHVICKNQFFTWWKWTLKLQRCELSHTLISWFLFMRPMSILFLLSEVTHLLESNTELIRTVEQLNMSLREGRSLDVSLRTLEAITGLKAHLESFLQGRRWRNAVERIWSFGPRRSGSCGT